MKKNEIKVDECYLVRVSSKIVTVRVDRIDNRPYPGIYSTHVAYHVTNLSTGKQLVFRSAQKFRGRAADPQKAQVIVAKDRKAQLEGRAKDGILTRSEAKELADHKAVRLEGEQSRPFVSSNFADLNSNGGTTHSDSLTRLLQQSIDIITLPTPQLLQLRTETLDPEVRRVAHDELKRRGYAPVSV